MNAPLKLRSLVVSFRLFLVTLMVVLLGSLAGCSSGSSGGGGSNSTTPSPVVTLISPAKLPAGSAAATLTISGSAFVSTSTVQVGGAVEVTTYVSATQLTATVPAAQLTNGTQLAVIVSNGVASSTAVNLEVDNPAPAIASISPSAVTAGTASAVVTFTGTGFVPSTFINVNGSPRATTFINSTQVSAALPSTDFVSAGTLAITAVNGTPGGGTSAAATLAIDNPLPAPVVSSISPAKVTAGSSGFTLTISGSNFIVTSTVSVGGAVEATTYVSPTQLTAAVPA